MIDTPFNIIAKRYLTIINKVESFGDTHTSSESLIKMLSIALQNEQVWPIEKLYNWLGYVAGVLRTYKIIDIDDERNFSRPVYHQYYASSNRVIPDTITIVSPLS